MKVYITKYALTQGIHAKEAKRLSEEMIEIVGQGQIFPTFYHGKEWAPDRESALKQAEAMVRKRILSLRKQIKRLENLEIEVHE